MSNIRYKSGDTLYAIMYSSPDIVLILKNTSRSCTFKQISSCSFGYLPGEVYKRDTRAEEYFEGYKVLTDQDKAELL